MRNKEVLKKYLENRLKKGFDKTFEMFTIKKANKNCNDNSTLKSSILNLGVVTNNPELLENNHNIYNMLLQNSI